MRGGVLDCYADEVNNEMVTWVKTSSGMERIADRDFRASFYVKPSPDKRGALLMGLKEAGVEHCWEKHRTWLSGPLEDVLKVTPRGYRNLAPLAKTVDKWGCHRDHTLFNVDLRMDTRYFLHRKVFPMGLMDVDKWKNLDTPFRLDYPMPDLRTSELSLRTSARRGMPSMDDRLKSVTLDDVVIEGRETDILERLQEAILERDPDVLVTDGGDSFHLPFLEKCAQRNEMELEMGREYGKRLGKGKSYFTYGRILYKPPAYKLRVADASGQRIVVHIPRGRDARIGRPEPHVKDIAAGHGPHVAGQRHQRHAIERSDAHRCAGNVEEEPAGGLQDRGRPGGLGPRGTYLRAQGRAAREGA